MKKITQGLDSLCVTCCENVVEIAYVYIFHVYDITFSYY